MTDFGQPTTVLVTGVGGRSVGAGILHALLRSSPEIAAQYTVIAADCDPFSWGLYKTDHRVIVPRADAADYVPCIRDLVRKFKIDAIIPGTEVEIFPLLAHSAELQPAKVIANSIDLLPLMYDKLLCATKLAAAGIPAVPTYRSSEWQIAAHQFGYPLIIKPSVGTGGSKGVTIAGNSDDVKKRLDHEQPAQPLCVQPYIDDATNEYTVGVLSDSEGHIIDSLVMRRHLHGLSLQSTENISGRRVVISSGYSQGFVIRSAVIQRFCEDVAQRLRSRGPLNLQLRIDPRSGEPLIFEVHPRFSGTTPIRADVGFNEPHVLLQSHLFGKQFGRLNYHSELAVMRAFEHVIVPLKDFVGDI